MTPTQQIALWADQLRDMSAQGLMYSPRIYDRANYRSIQQIAMEMLALATAKPLEEIESLRTTVFSHHTPRCVGDAAIIDMYQFCFLCQPLNGGKPEQLPSHAAEVLDAQWFGEGEMPLDVDPGHISRIREAFRVWRGDSRAYFD